MNIHSSNLLHIQKASTDTTQVYCQSGHRNTETVSQAKFHFHQQKMTAYMSPCTGLRPLMQSTPTLLVRTTPPSRWVRPAPTPPATARSCWRPQCRPSHWTVRTGARPPQQADRALWAGCSSPTCPCPPTQHSTDRGLPQPRTTGTGELCLIDWLIDFFVSLFIDLFLCFHILVNPVLLKGRRTPLLIWTPSFCHSSCVPLKHRLSLVSDCVVMWIILMSAGIYSKNCRESNPCNITPVNNTLSVSYTLKCPGQNTSSWYHFGYCHTYCPLLISLI